ncbi:MAG: Eco29kI family restriction endonuclease [Flavobacteriales bacterium]|nr:Eco29kI family restriction endonuclease [Flavobacteriales bacterium]
MSENQVFNPLDKANLGESITRALLSQPLEELGSLNRFKGTGVYVLYYHGSFKADKSIWSKRGSSEIPIYVGKAVEAGSRKGVLLEAAGSSTKLYARLKDHADSIRAATNLEIGDFTCRYLVLDPVWIPLAEALVIARFAPLWNSLIDGFGNHGVGGGRYMGMRPRWDTLHPGRAWAARCKDRSETSEQIEREIVAHLKGK